MVTWVTPGGARFPVDAARAALAQAFRGEAAALAREAGIAADPEHARMLRLRSWCWRATAERVARAPAIKWPESLIAHLRAAGSVPILGPEYGRQLRRLVDGREV